MADKGKMAIMTDPKTDVLVNPWRGQGLPKEILTGGNMADGEVVTDARAAQALFALCPAAHRTPLLDRPDLARGLGIGSLRLKDERTRMGLGSFKALGAAFAIARAADEAVRAGKATAHETALSGTTYVCASAGNHGLSMAAGAALFGATAVVLLAETVPEGFADRLRAKGARVIRHGAVYEDSMAEAMRLADVEGWNLLSDSSWVGYSTPARDVMEGYLIMGAEVANEAPEPPTHIFLQAGVGGMAAAAAAAARTAWGDAPQIIVVEPSRAPALIESIRAGRPVTTSGAASCMGRLDCKEPSHLALKYLAEAADMFMTVTDAEADETTAWLTAAGIGSSPSGTGGLTGLRQALAQSETFCLDAGSRVLLYVSEGAADD
ncbi:MAG: diaminopropionate ammonia-lyase [Minwuia thermotolerans]|nr:MAG: diaminopropionate ammonia-lyase [Minwuia thermotolerans]